MKKLNLFIPGVMIIVLIIISCQRESLERNVVASGANTAALTTQSVASSVTANKGTPSATCNPNAYVITLESHTQLANGNWEWIWSVRNPNPGNGNGNTVQNLSHWGMELASCVNLNSVVNAAYSGDGLYWTSFTATYQSDPSQSCMTTPVFKFDFGTVGGAKSYYRLIVSRNFTEGLVQGYYKSGVTTGCCTFSFTGINGCGSPEEVVE